MRASHSGRKDSRSIQPYQSLFVGPEGSKEKKEGEVEEDSGVSTGLEDSSHSGEASSTVAVMHDEMTSKDYFTDNYGHYAVHEGFLKDGIVSLAFRDAMLMNTFIFRGQVVLNIGCGVGLLALFAAQAEAAQVIAVDNSSIVEYARKIVEANKKKDVITVLSGTVEDLDLPMNTVNIILCDWVGFGVFYNNLISSVLFARDKWLCRKYGKIFPDKCELFIVGMDDRKYRTRKIDWWENVYGFDMKALGDVALGEPVVGIVSQKHIVTSSWSLMEFDLHTLSSEELSFNVPFRIVAQEDAYIHGLVTYFNVNFSKCHQPTGFSTSPYEPMTNYKQTLFHIKGDLLVKAGEEVSGRFEVKPAEKNEVRFTLQVDCDGESASYHERIEYVMSRRF